MSNLGTPICWNADWLLLGVIVLIALVWVVIDCNKAATCDLKLQLAHQAQQDMAREETIRLQIMARGGQGEAVQRISRYPHPPPAPPMPKENL